MAHVITMPEVLAGVAEAAIAAWSVGEGDTVATGDTIAEVETDKAVVDLPSQVSGVVGRLLVEQGQTVEVGTPLLVLLSEGEAIDDIDPALLSGGAAPATTVSAPAPAVEDAPVDADPVPRPAPTLAVHPGQGSTERLFASPIARRLAREHQIDLATVTGSGPQQRITRRDIARHISAPQASSQPAPRASQTQSTEPGTVVPHSRMRRAIARRLTEAKATVPHFYLRADCRVDALLALRREVNAASQERVSVNDFVVMAVARALTEVPEANVRWTDEGTLHLSDVSVAVAVTVDDGLLTPVVRDVASRRLGTVSADVKDLAARARSGELRQHELEGGSMTVSNLGMYGVEEFAAIINPPQCAILAVGTATPRAVVVDGSVVPATVMTVTLSADHRVLDGELAARWLAAFVTAIEHPASLLV